MIQITDGRQLSPGDWIYVAQYQRPFTVQTTSERYAICTRPAFGSVLYFIADFIEQIMGTENLIFPAGAETPEQREEMMQRLHGETGTVFGPTEISHRKRCTLWITKIIREEER